MHLRFLAFCGFLWGGRMKQQFLLRNTNIRANAISAINQLQLNEKRPVVIEIKEMTRSIDQNSKLWAILGDIS
ncbi:recombination protein NinB, partial [Escherichia coli]|uniref:recombination protein NinB n=1 Tax=Escherichia coli TaxID=562 RepID=UPI002A36A773